jgi:hypothetical protein
MQEQAVTLKEAVSIFKRGGARGSERNAPAKPSNTPPAATTAVSPTRKERKLIKAKGDADGDWKEF